MVLGHAVFRLATAKMVFQMYRSQGSDAGWARCPAQWRRETGRAFQGLWRAWVGLTVEAARGSSHGRDEGMRQIDEQKKLPTLQTGLERPQLPTVPFADVC